MNIPIGTPYEVRRSKKTAKTYAETHLNLIAGVRYERSVTLFLETELETALTGFRGEAIDMPAGASTAREAF